MLTGSFGAGSRNFRMHKPCVETKPSRKSASNVIATDDSRH